MHQRRRPEVTEVESIDAAATRALLDAMHPPRFTDSMSLEGTEPRNRRQRRPEDLAFEGKTSYPARFARAAIQGTEGNAVQMTLSWNVMNRTM